MFYEKRFFKISKNAQENPVPESLLNKVAGLILQLPLTGDSDTGAFLRSLQNFYKHLMYRTFPDDYF